MSVRAWLTQDSIPSRRTFAINLPDNEMWRADLLGALYLLTQPENWQQFGDLSPDEMADEWLNVFLQFATGLTTMIPAGTVLEFAGATLPDGFLWCDGEEISRTTYAELFAAIGTKYGAGNGTTTFNTPNRAGRVAVGLTDDWPDFNDLGKTGGEIQHTLGVAEMPSHSHPQDPHTHVQNAHSHAPNASTLFNITGPVGWTVSGSNMTIGGNGNTSQNATATNQNTTATNQAFGGGAAHENMPPFLIENFIIKY